MAPNFLSKFVKNNPTLSPDNSDARTRTLSDVGPTRSRTISAVVNTDTPPSFVLTTDGNDSPVQPSTPGSLHRTSSFKDGERRARSESLPAKDVNISNTSLSSSPLNPKTSLDSRANTAAPPGGSPSVKGLGIDLGTPDASASRQSADVTSEAATVAPSTSSTNGFDKLRHKLSARSLRSQTKASPAAPPSQATQIPQVISPVSSAGQEVEVPERTRSIELVDSPSSTSDITPTTTGFPPPPNELDASTFSPALSTTSAKSAISLQASVPDSDSVSIASSANKKRPWRSGSMGKKRKPTGLASAIASSGLAMANPGVTQSLAQFAPPPMPTVASPRSPQSAPRRSVSGGSNRPPTASTTSRTRVNGASGPISENGDGYYTDETESEDGLDLDDVDIPVTGFAVASNKRNADFHEMFQSVPEGDYLIEDYGCALQREILIQGRLYISENHICFHANIFGWVTDLIIPVTEILSVEKRMTALFIPNAIQITTRTSKYTFASFLSRDTTYDVIHNVWKLSRPDSESIRSGSIQSGSAAALQDPSLVSTLDGRSDLKSPMSPLVGNPTSCDCLLNGSHYSNLCMQIVLPGTPEKIYNLMFTSEFIKDFLRNEQNLKDLQISDWIPDPETKLLTRKFSYIKILNGVVKQTKCELTDEMRHCNFEDYVSMETTTRTPDVPSGSVFSVKTRTCIMWAGPATSKVIVSTEVQWTGRSFIKSMITSASIDGQKSYHNDLEVAMRKYIAEHKNEFLPEGLDIPDAPALSEETKEEAVATPRLSFEEANKKRESERNQRATQWAFDTLMGAYKVAKQSTLDALDLVGDAWDQSSSTTILYFVIVVLVISNLWTLLMVGRREEVGRRKEMIKVDEQRKWVSTIVAALHEERLHETESKLGHELLNHELPASREGLQIEVGNLVNVLDTIEERVKALRNSLKDLD